MKDSIIVNMEYAMYDMIDGSPNPHRHHCIGGRGYRELSDQLGLWIPLCERNHTEGERPAVGVRCDVHHCRKMSDLVHIIAQVSDERNWIAEHANDGLSAEELLTESRKRFRALFGKSFL